MNFQLLCTNFIILSMVIEKLTFSTSISFTAAQRICYNLFQTYSENVCIDASLVMDQLEDVISHKKLTKRNSTNFQQDQDQNNFDTLSTTTTKDDCTSNDFMGSFSSLPAPDLGHVNDQGLRKAWSSIQSLENRLCPKSNDVPITLKLASVTSRIMYATHILLSMEWVGTTKASNHFIFPLYNTQKKFIYAGDKFTYINITCVRVCPRFSKSLSSPGTKWYSFRGQKSGTRTTRYTFSRIPKNSIGPT